VTGPRWLYLHGFASGPDSSKGTALARHYQDMGVHLERLNLRVPSLERLRLSAMIETVRKALGGPLDRAVLFGSSLGGLTAARAAEADPRACALVLLAPAFRFVESWKKRLGPDGLRAWEKDGLQIHDYAEDRETRLDFGFLTDAEAVESKGAPDVRVPTLIVHGRRDETVEVAVSREWARGKPWVRLVETDDGHDLAASMPRIREEADRFLAPFVISSPQSLSPRSLP
jgi:pimeloyl-ACP methyl ester carboxylesterase